MSSDPQLRLFHTGLIVDSLDGAMGAMSRALGLTWAPPKTSTTPVQGPDGVADREVRFTYSMQGPHFIELLEQIDPTPYLNLTGGRRVHHLGYYTDDLARASAMLEANGYRRELSGIAPDGAMGRATFHYNPEAPGMWIELVSDEIAQEIGDWIGATLARASVPFVSPFA